MKANVKPKQQQLSNKYSNHVVYLSATIIHDGNCDKMINNKAHKLCAWLALKTLCHSVAVLLRENIGQLWGFNRGDLNIFASAVPNNKDTYKTKRNGKLQHISLFKQ